MKQRILALFLALVMCLSLLPVSSMAEGITTVANGDCSEDLSWSLDSAGKLTISGTGAMDDYVYTKTKITIPWVDFSSSIKSVIIGDSVTSIGNNAFRDCSNLASVTIGSSVTRIGSYAFRDCINLASVTIPNSVTSIGASAFQNCSNLTSVTIPNSVTSIGNSAFYNCSNLASVTIGSSVTSIGASAFSDCSKLGSVTIPNSVTSIGNSAFYNCSNLASVTIGSSVMSIGSDAFADTAIYNDSTKWENGVLYIGSYLIKANTDISSYSIKEGTLCIADSAFNKRASLESVSIPNSVTSIGASAFRDCSNLESVTTGSSVTSIRNNAFDGTAIYNDSTKWENGVLYIGNYLIAAKTDITSCSIKEGTLCIAVYAFRDCSNLESVTIPNSVTSIGVSGFYKCSSLASVEMPNSVKSIGGTAFYGCSKLASAKFAGNAPAEFGTNVFAACASGFKLLCPKDDSTWTTGDAYNATDGKWNGYPIEFYTVQPTASGTDGNISWALYPDGKLTISGTGAMNNYLYILYNRKLNTPWADYSSSIKSVVIGDSVTSIGSYAFYFCSNLESVTIGSSVTSIGSDAFVSCSSLESVSIPNSVISIGISAFENCSKLESVTIPNSVISIGGYAFQNCSSLASVTIGSSVTSIGSNAFAGTALYKEDSNWENEVLYLGNYLIRAKEDITSCSIKEGTLYIADSAFTECGSLESLAIPDSVKSIGEFVFNMCNNLKSVTIGSSVKSIGQYAFAMNDNLEIVKFTGNAPTTLGSDVFNNCSLDFRLLAPNGDSTWTTGDAYDSSEGTWNGYPIEFYTVQPTASGTDGNISWALYPDGKLTISGAGAMNDYSAQYSMVTYTLFITAPWANYSASIKSVIIEDSVTSIGKYAFFKHSQLESVTIGSSVESIGEQAFLGCSSLESVIIPSSVKSIGASAFCGCSSLESVEIPNSVESIDDYAFENCSKLASVTISDSLKSIGCEVFCGTALYKENSKWEKGVLYIGKYLIEASYSITITSCSIKEGTLLIAENAFYGAALESVTIPESVTGIGVSAFASCEKLESVNIPSSVESIGDEAFAYSTSLTSAKFAGNAPETFGTDVFKSCATGFKLLCPKDDSTWTTEPAYNATAKTWNGYPIEFYTVQPTASGTDGNISWALYPNGKLTISGTGAMNDYVYTKTKITIPWVDFSSSIKSVIIGDSVTSIGNNAFRDCVNLESVTIGSSVTSIGSYAVYKCSNLESVTIGSSVTSIGEYAFYNCSKLGSVTIPDSVTSIGSGTFDSCSSLASVTIGSSLMSIGNNAFNSCSKLESVTIPNSVISIGSNAFRDCSSLASVTIPNSVTSIGSNAFAGTALYKNVAKWESEVLYIGNYLIKANSEAAIKSYSIKEGTLCIADCAFEACNSLESVTIPNSVTSIGAEVFYNCSSLASVTMPSSVTSIAKSTFYKCSSLASVTIPSSVTSIGAYAFYNCISLASVTIPNSVTSIGSYAFQNCSSLASVTIPNSVTSIGGSAFYKCSSLESVTIGSSVTSIGGSAFNDTKLYNDSTKWENNVLYIGNYLIKANTAITSCSIKEGTLCIADNAFQYCSNLASVTIPNSVTCIGTYAFRSCLSLASAKFAGNAPETFGTDVFKSCATGFKLLCPNGDSTWTTEPAYNATAKTWNGYPIEFYTVQPTASGTDGNISWALYPDGKLTISGAGAMNDYQYSKTKTTIPWVADSSKIKSVVIGDSVTSVGNNAFRDCSNLASVTIGSSVTSIGNYAFSGCSNLGSVTIPNSVTSIGGYAFSGCSSLASVTIGSSVTSIGANAFYGCSKLGSVTIPNSVTSIGNYAFSYCSNLASVTIGSSVTSIGDSAFRDCSSLASVTIPNSVTSIGGSAFSGCSNLASVTIPNSVTRVGSNAFYGTAIYIDSTKWENGVLYIGNYLLNANANTDNTSYSIKEGTLCIADSAFEACKSLESVTIPNSVTSIGNYVFENCSSLASVRIPNSVTSIGGYAFRGCSELASVTIGSSVTSIGNLAFDGTAIYNDSTKWENNVLYIGNYLIAAKTDITSCSIKEGTLCIADKAFQSCSSLESVTIPNSVISIGVGGFYKCSSLASVEMPNSVKNIGIGAFNGCSKLASAKFAGNAPASFGANVFGSCATGFKLLCPNGDSTWTTGDAYSSTDGKWNGYPIEFYTVQPTASGTDGNISWALYPDGKLTISGTGAMNNYKYSYSNKTTNTPWVADSLKIKSVVIDDSVTSIGSNAFRNCINLASVTIGSSVANIASYAFQYCSSLASVTIPNSVTIIGNYAFSDCSNLASVTIGSSVESIRACAFQNCSSLASVTIPNSVTSIENRAFSGCSNLASVTIPNSVTSVGSDAFYGTAIYNDSTKWENGVLYIGNYLLNANANTDNTSYSIKEGTLCIADNAFQNCSKLESVRIPNSVMKIGAGAFQNCSNLTSVTIPNSVTIISTKSFYNCSKLASVTIPNSVTIVSESAFAGTAIYNDSTKWDNGVLYIGNYLIVAKTDITSCSIKEGTLCIAYYAFRDCSSLESVTIPNSVTSIGGSAFYDCSSLTSAKFAGNAPAVFGASVFASCATGFKLLCPENDSTWTTGDAYNATDGKWNGYQIEFQSPHTHSFTYSADGATITATCANTGCTAQDTTLILKADEATYDGNTHGAALMASETDAAESFCGSETLPAIAYEKWNGTDWDSIEGAPTDAGRYRASITVGSGTGAKTAYTEYCIGEAESSVSTAPTANTLTYNASEQELVTAGTASNGTMKYSIGTETEAGTEWSESIPTGTNAGTYYVWYKCAGNANYSDTEANCITVSIGKAAPTVSTNPSASAITYGQKLENSTLSGGTASQAGSFAWKDSTIAPAVSDSSKTDYVVVFTPTDSSNYNSFECNVKLVVNKANPTVSTNPSASAITYGQTLASSNLTNGTASVSGSFAWETTATAPVAADSNATAYKVIFTPDDTANYNTAECYVKLVVNKATPSVTAPTAKTLLTYTATEQGLVNAGSSANGTVKYSIGTGTEAGTEWSDSIPTGKNAGTYYVWYKCVGDANHNDTTPLCVTVSIAAKSIVGAVVTLDGNALYADGTDRTQEVKSVALNGWTDAITYTVSGNTKSAAGSYTLTVEGTGNYTGSVNKDFAIFEVPDQDDTPVSEELVNVVVGSGKVSLEAKVEGDDLKTVIDTPVSDFINAIVTAEDLLKVEQGATLNIWMEIKELDEETAGEQVIGDMVQAVEDEGFDLENTEIAYFNIDLFKQFENADKDPIPEPASALTITISVPENLRYANAIYSVVHYHEGKAETIDCVYDHENGTVTFESDQFSPFGLVVEKTGIYGMSIIGDTEARGFDVKTYTVSFDGVRPEGSVVVWTVSGSYNLMSSCIGDSLTIYCYEDGSYTLTARLVDKCGRVITDEDGNAIMDTKEAEVTDGTDSFMNVLVDIIMKILSKLVNWIKVW